MDKFKHSKLSPPEVIGLVLLVTVWLPAVSYVLWKMFAHR